MLIGKRRLKIDEQDTTGATYTVKLGKVPSANVTVTVGGTTGTEVTATPASLTFTTSNWGTAQTVTVTAGDDADTTRDTATLTHSAAGGGYDSVSIPSVAVEVNDNDDHGVTVNPRSMTIFEEVGELSYLTAPNDTYWLVLTGAPTADATITIAGHSGTDLTLTDSGGAEISTLTFTTSNWSTPQRVKVTAAYDEDRVDEPLVTLTHSAAGGGYDSVSIPSVTVKVKDIYNRGIRINPRQPTVIEGSGGGDYTVVMTGPPAEPVTITMEPPEGEDVVVTPSTLVFTTDDWRPAKTVRVRQGHDEDAEHERIRITHSATGDGFESYTIAAAEMLLVDNDNGGRPGRPRDVGASPGNGSVGLKWTPPVEDPAKPVLHYEYQQEGETQWAATDGPETSTEVTGLTNGESYEFRLRAVNAEGKGEASEPSAPVTPVGTGLAAELASVPSSHDGSTPFELKLEFSEEVPLSYRTLRDDAFEATGGAVTGARRAQQGSNIGWWITVEPAGDGTVSVTLPARACAETGAVCTADGEPLSDPVSATVEGPPAPAPLTASFVEVPAEHDGSTPFELRLEFSEEMPLSYATLRDHAFEATGGAVTGARRVTAGANLGWWIRVEPAAADAVTVTLPARACGETGAVCAADGRALSAPASATVQGPPGVSVADAAVAEGPNAALSFTVTLGRVASGTVTVDYATSDGTATAGSDYVAAAGPLTFAAGETAKTVSVSVLDDAHDEGDETLTLTLANPSGAYLADGEATGTIGNHDPMPQAWLARFGRTVADQVLDAVEGRMTAAPVAGRTFAVAGQRVGSGAAWSTDAFAAPGLNTGFPRTDVPRGAAAVAGRLRGAVDGDRPAPGLRDPAALDLFAGSAFALTGGSAEGGFGVLWGRGAVSRFDGREGGLALDGEVASVLVGVDVARGRAAAGLVFARSRGEGAYSSESGDGAAESTLTGLYPWGRYAVSERLSVWGVAGRGTGTLRLTPDGISPTETGLGLTMGALGGRGVVVTAPAGGGFEVVATSDALVVRTVSGEARPAGAGLAAAAADVTRLRLGLEGTRPIRWDRGAALVPSVEIGVRRDDGDAETGFGADIGAGFAWTDPSLGVEAEFHARGLLTHAAGGFRERGYSGSLAWDPAPTSRLGPSLTLWQTAGARPSGGMDALLGPESAWAAGVPQPDDDAFDRRTLAASLGYGFALFGGRWTGTPELGLRRSDARAEAVLGFGWRLEGAGAERFELRLEGAHTQAKIANGKGGFRIGARLTALW